MKISKTGIKDLYVIEPKVFNDKRGWFIESYNRLSFSESGININFIQDNHSKSISMGVLRGLHFQLYPYSQTKLVRCTKGRIWDVAVDLRSKSPTYLKWFGLELSDKNYKMLLIPKGFAHGFVTLENNSEVQYKVDEFYKKEFDRSLNYKDKQINIKWPIKKLLLSEKDHNAPNLSELDVNF
jgi:dTDP-4-dehydrorhamnose 3,5-epimerase